MLIVYSKNNCPNCEIIKDVLSKSSVEYSTVDCKALSDIAKHLQESEFVEDIYNFSAFPILVDAAAHWIGDFSLALQKYDEPLLSKRSNRHSLYPITYPAVYDMYKQARASYWQPEEISLAKDMQDWDTLTDDERHFVSYILAFFSASDGIVNENIDINFSKEIQVPEIRAFYAFQEAMEAVHSETYSILLDKYVTKPQEKQFLQDGVKNIPSVKLKAEWAFKHMNCNLSFARRLLAFACVEGIYFSGSFCAIYWLKKRNLLPGLAFSNELISRDEGLHTEFAVLLYNMLKHRISQEDAHSVVGDAVKNEKHFITEALPCRLIGMNEELMSQYIEFVADRLLTSLRYKKLYNATNPFDFMENICLNGKTNFFEKRVGEYAKANVMVDECDNTFDIDADF